jgi:hypothetical protein
MEVPQNFCWCGLCGGFREAVMVRNDRLQRSEALTSLNSLRWSRLIGLSALFFLLLLALIGCGGMGKVDVTITESAQERFGVDEEHAALSIDSS